MFAYRLSLLPPHAYVTSTGLFILLVLLVSVLGVQLNPVWSFVIWLINLILIADQMFHLDNQSGLLQALRFDNRLYAYLFAKYASFMMLLIPSTVFFALMLHIQGHSAYWFAAALAALPGFIVIFSFTAALGLGLKGSGLMAVVSLSLVLPFAIFYAGVEPYIQAGVVALAPICYNLALSLSLLLFLPVVTHYALFHART